MLNSNRVDYLHKTPQRKIFLKPKEGGAKDAGTGMTDPRLFKDDGSHILAVMDKQTSLWSLRYQHGILPKDLQQMWTSFPMLLRHVTEYYNKRNVEVVHVED